jgi:hypothetical protein
MALPGSFERRLASASQPVIITDKKNADGELFAWLAERAWLGALAIASLVGVLLIGSVSAAATHGRHPGFTHAPKTLDGPRAADRHAGHHAPAVKPAKAVTHVVHRPRRR